MYLCSRDEHKAILGDNSVIVWDKLATERANSAIVSVRCSGQERHGKKPRRSTPLFNQSAINSD